MAHRIITQIAITGARVFARAFTEAYRQANARSAAGASAKAGGGSGSGGAALSGGTAGLTLQEACQILNLPPPKSQPSTSPTSIPFGSPGSNTTFSAAEATKDLEAIAERFKRLFDQNDPNKGGSFYLQSKVLRARERMEAEVGKRVEREREAEEMRERPKVYKDR